MENKIENISLDLIDDPSTPMRQNMNEANLQELADSIRDLGLIQPITVRVVGDRYEVVAGHRRLRASKIASMPMIKSIVSDIDEGKADDIKIHENLFREDINPVDEARFIMSLIDKYKYTPTELSKRVGRSVAYLKSRYELLEYPDYLMYAVETGKIGLTAAAYLNKITNENIRREYTRFAVIGGITVKRAEAWYTSWAAGQLPRNAEEFVPSVNPHDNVEAPLLVPCVLCRMDDDLMNVEMVYVHSNCRLAIHS